MARDRRVDLAPDLPFDVIAGAQEIAMGASFVDDWAKAKEEYYDLTGQKTPRDAFKKFFSTSHTGLSACIDALTIKWNLRKEKDQTVKEYVGLVEDFCKTQEKYLKTLRQLGDDELKKNPPKKDVHTKELRDSDLTKGLNMLEAKLEKYRSSFELNRKRLNLERANVVEEERLRETNRLELYRGFAHFQAAAKAILATPTEQVYNREFGPGKAVTKLEEALENCIKVSRSDKDKEMAKKWLADVKPWGAHGELRFLNVPQSLLVKDKVLQSLKKAMETVNKCKKAFGINN